MPWEGSELWLADVAADGPPRACAAHCRRAGRVAVPAAVVAARRAVRRLRPHAAGGTSTASRARRCARCARWRPSSASRCGCSARRCSASPATTRSSPRSSSRARAGSCGSTWRAARRSRIETPFTDLDELCAGPGFVRRDRGLAHRAGAGRAHRRGERRAPGAGAQRRRTARRGLPVAAGAHRLPQRRRSHRARLLLRAAQPRLRGAGGRAAAARRVQPRRADVDEHEQPEALDPVLDQPRLRRARRELRRQQRLRPRLPRPAQGPVGRGRRRGLRRRRALPGRERAASTASAWRSAAAAPAASRRCARWPSIASSRPARATTASAT